MLVQIPLTIGPVREHPQIKNDKSTFEDEEILLTNPTSVKPFCHSCTPFPDNVRRGKIQIECTLKFPQKFKALKNSK